MTAAKETTRDVPSLAAVCFLPETRVWGLDPEKQPSVGAWSRLSSTTRWGCGYAYGGIASGETDQRMYASGYGRFNSPDPYQASGNAKSPVSWNRYSYTRGDPVNRIDPRGLFDCSPEDPSCYCNDDGCCTSDSCYCTDDASGCGGTGGGGGGGSEPPPAPDCTNSYTSAQLSFVGQNYAASLGAASIIQSAVDSSGVQINISNVTDAFLDWSAWESGWGGSNIATKNHNYFGAGRGSWGGTASSNCSVRSAACWASSVSWGTELTDILGFSPHTGTNPNPGNATYAAFVELALINNPNASAATIIQAIANAGFNASTTYGSQIAGPSGINVQPIIDCLKQDGIIQ